MAFLVRTGRQVMLAALLLVLSGCLIALTPEQIGPVEEGTIEDLLLGSIAVGIGNGNGPRCSLGHARVNHCRLR